MKFTNKSIQASSTNLPLLYLKKQIFDSIFHILDLQPEIGLRQVSHNHEVILISKNKLNWTSRYNFNFYFDNTKIQDNYIVELHANVHQIKSQKQ